MAKSKNTGLGRGLDAIFLDNTAEMNLLAGAEGASVLRVTEIEPRPDQPRKNFDNQSLIQLADSISAHGLIQPIAVRLHDNGFYRIIAGERRWRAAKMAGLMEVPVIIMDIDDKKASEIALIENIQREDLNPIEEALAYRTLMNEYDLTQDEVAKSIGRSRSAVANSLRLLDLPETVYKMVVSGELSAGHARALLGVNNAGDILSAAETVVKKELSVRETEEFVRSINRREDGAKNGGETEPAADTNENEAANKKAYKLKMEKKLTERLGRNIKIVDSGKRSRIEIEYMDTDDLESIIRILCGENVFDEIV